MPLGLKNMVGLTSSCRHALPHLPIQAPMLCQSSPTLEEHCTGSKDRTGPAERGHEAPASVVLSGGVLLHLEICWGLYHKAQGMLQSSHSPCTWSQMAPEKADSKAQLPSLPVHTSIPLAPHTLLLLLCLQKQAPQVDSHPNTG